MFARSQQLSSPLLLPMIGSIFTAGLSACFFIQLPPRATLNVRQIVLQAAFDLILAACIHAVTVWSIWRLIREYIEPSRSTLVIHVWAVVVWVPLIATLGAERSVWVSCIVPWACANGITFLNLWSKLPQVVEREAPRSRALFEPPSAPPLWRTLLPYCLTIFILQTGLVASVSRHPWSATALFSAGVLLFLLHHPLVYGVTVSRQKFSRFSLLQTAVVFFLITTALTPYLQKAYGLRSLLSYFAIEPAHTKPAVRPAFASDYSGIILTLPPKPHPRIEPISRANPIDFSAPLARPVVIPFDGAYWYFKPRESRPRFDALVRQGDPLKANVRSTDGRQLVMEAHQTLATPIAGDCCRALRIELLNGDDRPSPIRVELRLATRRPGSPLSLGIVTIPFSQLQPISRSRAPVPESLEFSMPAAARTRLFDEITVVIKAPPDNTLAGSKIAIQNFVLVP
jgi:hypothetical protein